MKAAGHIARWAMWWCMDWPADARCLLGVDHIGRLKEQEVVLERDTTTVIDGKSRRSVVFLTGEGKLMGATNGGGKCWCCGDVTILHPLDHVLEHEHERRGSFWRSIKANRSCEKLRFLRCPG